MNNPEKYVMFKGTKLIGAIVKTEVEESTGNQLYYIKTNPHKGTIFNQAYKEDDIIFLDPSKYTVTVNPRAYMLKKYGLCPICKTSTIHEVLTDRDESDCMCPAGTSKLFYTELDRDVYELEITYGVKITVEKK